MDDRTWLADRFEQHRPHLRRVAMRMLGSADAADDAVQEAWLRLDRTGADGVTDLRAWLTTVVARVCLDALRARTARREDSWDELNAERVPSDRPAPHDDVAQTDAVGLAMLVVLDMLTPAERVAFVLHDMFGVPFDEVGPLIERSPEAARQLASRARRRVQGRDVDEQSRDARHRAVVAAFLAAARNGDFTALLAMLDPNVVLRADRAAVAAAAANADRGAPALAAQVSGAHEVAARFVGGARVAQLALLDGAPGAIWAPGGRPRAAFTFVVGDDGRIVELGIVHGHGTIAHMAIEILDDQADAVD